MKFRFWSLNLLVFFFLFSWFHSVRAEGLEFPVDQMRHMLGVAVGVAPDYEGSDDYQFVAAPYGKFIFENSERYIMVSGYELQINLINHPWFRLGPSLNYHPGRDDDVEDDVVSKMKDIDDTVEAGGFIGVEFIDSHNPRKRFLANIDFLADVGDEYNGYYITFSVRGWYPLTKRLDYGAGVVVTYADNDYMETYFGVDRRDSAATGLSVFDADSGVKDFRINQLLLFHLNQHWHLGAGFQYRRLVNDAEDSPIVDKRGDEDQWLGGIGIGYRW